MMLLHVRKAVYRTGIIILIAISVIFNPITTGNPTKRSHAYAAQPFQTVPPVNATIVTPIDPSSPIPTPLPTVGPQTPSIFIDGDTLVVGSYNYAIGDYFLDASAIPLGATTASGGSKFGYSQIVGIEDHVVIWITGADGVVRYLIVNVDDPLFTGHAGVEDGFEDYLGFLKDAEDAISVAGGGNGAGVMGLVIAQLYLCAPTAGSTCISAVATAVMAIIGGFVAVVYNFITKYLPQIDNLRYAFEGIDIVRPKIN